MRKSSRTEITKLKFYRPDFEFVVDVKRENLLSGANALEKLGIESWKKSRNWRSSGFFGHYATYAEVLQLIASLAFGLFIASFFRAKARRRRDKSTKAQRRKQFSVISAICFFTFHFLFCVAAMSLALLLTVTRASQLAFLISAVVIVLASGRRKLLLGLAAIILPIALGGLIFLQQSRNVGFFDAKDDSTTYRQTIYREGFDLWTENARNFSLGVGMDSIKRYVERLASVRRRTTFRSDIFTRRLCSCSSNAVCPRFCSGSGFSGFTGECFGGVKLRSYELRSELQIPQSAFRIPPSKQESFSARFGGLIGFFTSGLVHYNLGDQEVAMVFFILMGLSVM